MTYYGPHKIRLKRPLDNAATIKSLQPFVESLALALSRNESPERNQLVFERYCTLMDKAAKCSVKNLLK